MSNMYEYYEVLLTVLPLTTHRHHPLAPDTFPAFQGLAEAHQVVALVAEDLAEQEALLLGAVYQDPTIGDLRNWAQIWKEHLIN